MRDVLLGVVGFVVTLGCRAAMNLQEAPPQVGGPSSYEHSVERVGPPGTAPVGLLCAGESVATAEAERWLEIAAGSVAEMKRIQALREQLEGEPSQEASLTEDAIEDACHEMSERFPAYGLELELVDCSEHPCVAALGAAHEVDVPKMMDYLADQEEWSQFTYGAMYSPLNEDGGAVLISIWEPSATGDEEKVFERYQNIIGGMKRERNP